MVNMYLFSELLRAANAAETADLSEGRPTYGSRQREHFRVHQV
jgi:hypothetical protein